MKSETEMNLFFARNCYTDAERSRVRAWRPYQEAMEREDVVHAQEIATRVLEQGSGLPANSFAPRPPSSHF